MTVPIPTPIYRFIHIDNLAICMRRAGMYSPNHTPNDGLLYKTIHNIEIQQERHSKPVPCGPRGAIHDYVSFYFGYLSPMMLQLHSGQVEGYTEGQRPLIYLVSTAQAVQASGAAFVFSDGHGIAAFTDWYDDLKELRMVDWDVIRLRYWADDVNDMDRQRRKQAEFLVHKSCDWSLIHEIGVIDSQVKEKVEEIQQKFPATFYKPVMIRRDWYYH